MKKYFIILTLLILAACAPCDCPEPTLTPTIESTLAPTITQTPEPTIITTPEDTPEPFCPDGLVWIMVGDQNAPLREVAAYNAKGVPVWGIFGKSNTSERIIAKANLTPPKELCAWPDAIKGDGGNYAYRLYSGQQIDGDWLPLSNSPTSDKYLYILERHITP